MQFVENSIHGDALETQLSRWSTCSLCPLHQNRQQTALWRGFMPAEVLFISDYPSDIDSQSGYPLNGPEKRLLDQIIKDTNELLLSEEQGIIKLPAYTTLVSCPPKKNADPSKIEIGCCADRLNETINLSTATLIVRLGKLAQTHVKTKHLQIDIDHPRDILNTDKALQGFAIRKAVSTLFNGILDIRTQ